MSGRCPGLGRTEELIDECLPYFAVASNPVPGRDRSDTAESLISPTCPEVVRASVARIFIHDGAHPRYSTEIAEAVVRFPRSGLSVAVLTPQGQILNDNMKGLIAQAVEVRKPGTSLTFFDFSNGRTDQSEPRLPEGIQRRYSGPKPKKLYNTSIITAWFEGK